MRFARCMSSAPLRPRSQSPDARPRTSRRLHLGRLWRHPGRRRGTRAGHRRRTTGGSAVCSPSSSVEALTRRSAKPATGKPSHLAKPKSAPAKTPRAAKAEIMTEPRRESFWRQWGLALPLVVFAGLAGLFWFALHGGDPSRLPSALVGKPVPEFTLPPIEGLTAGTMHGVDGFNTADLGSGKPTIVNVWASWCVPVPRGAPVADRARQGAGRPPLRHQLQGRSGGGPAVSWPLWQSLCPRRRRSAQGASPSIGASMACPRPM